MWGNVFLTVAGAVTWGLMQSGVGERGVEEVTKKIG